jgi:hypothetical protein
VKNLPLLGGLAVGSERIWLEYTRQNSIKRNEIRVSPLGAQQFRVLKMCLGVCFVVLGREHFQMPKQYRERFLMCQKNMGRQTRFIGNFDKP